MRVYTRWSTIHESIHVGPPVLAHTRKSTAVPSYREVHFGPPIVVLESGPDRTCRFSVDLPVEVNHPALPLSPAKWTSRYCLRVEAGAEWTSRYARPLNMVDFPVYRPCEDHE